MAIPVVEDDLIQNRGHRRYWIIPTSEPGIYFLHSRRSSPRARRALYQAENGKCYWCHKTTRWSRKVEYPDAPTIDHLYSRRDPRRYVGENERLCVLACYNCNWGRAKLEEEMMRPGYAMRVWY